MAESPSEIEGTRRKGGGRAREAAAKVSGRTLICLLAGGERQAADRVVVVACAAQAFVGGVRLTVVETDADCKSKCAFVEAFNINISVVHSFHLAATRHLGILCPAISRMGSFVCSIGPP